MFTNTVTTSLHSLVPAACNKHLGPQDPQHGGITKGPKKKGTMKLSTQRYKLLFIGSANSTESITTHPCLPTERLKDPHTMKRRWHCWHGCHEPRYWSMTDQYNATLLQGKQVQDMSLWFPYQLRPGQTVGNSHGHSLVQVSECGNELYQSMGKLYHNQTIR